MAKEEEIFFVNVDGADELRKEINKQGYEISDTADGNSFISGQKVIR